ncbi:MAG: zinc-dependent peptidase [Candidatus Krumholzibacteria bacterium]|nr:zinc-dependent peptidase [Candidatus Krumholzibacteria bacterium]
MKKRRRQRLLAAPFPPAWLEHIERNFPLYRRLPARDQQELLGHIKVFVAEKHFEGCGGLEITDEIRVTIAAQACLLLLNRKTDYYPRVTSILVYPSAYIARAYDRAGGGAVSEFDDVRLGEAWSHGTVVLSWDDVKHGAADIRDGRNLVLHEFAHQLDGESGTTRGAPVLEQHSMYVAWARVLGDAYEKLRSDAVRGRRTVLDTYGATNEAEFFAVITEAFFERPKELKRTHPELYDQLKAFYRQDPMSYFG